jgi:outer membrane autotransporter protein
MLTGYDHPVGMFTIGPRAGINWTNTHVNDYSENGSTGLELKYDDQYANSLQSILGLQAQAAVSTTMGVLVPQVNADYIHEFANSQRYLKRAIRSRPESDSDKVQIPKRCSRQELFQCGNRAADGTAEWMAAVHQFPCDGREPSV